MLGSVVGTIVGIVVGITVVASVYVFDNLPSDSVVRKISRPLKQTKLLDTKHTHASIKSKLYKNIPRKLVMLILSNIMVQLLC